MEKLYEDVTDIFAANGGKTEEVIENLPEKIQTVFWLESLKGAIVHDGLLSVFYSESLYAIKRLRRALDSSGSTMAGDLFDEAFQLVKSKFTWSNEHINFISQRENNVLPYEFFSEIIDRTEEIEGQISDIVFVDEFDKHLESYLKS